MLSCLTHGQQGNGTGREANRAHLVDKQRKAQRHAQLGGGTILSL